MVAITKKEKRTRNESIVIINNQTVARRLPPPVAKVAIISFIQYGYIFIHVDAMTIPYLDAMKIHGSASTEMNVV